MALLISVATAIAAMAILIQWNLGRGFLEYVNAQDKERVAAISQRFSARFEQEGNWGWATKRGQWRQMTRPEGADRPPPRRRNREGRGRRPPPPPPTALGPRLSLFNESMIPIMGPAIDINNDRVIRQPIRVGDKPVGWLVYKPLRKVSSRRDTDFLRQQSYSFLLMSALILLAAAIVGYLFARHLTQPITRLNNFVGKLTDGRYSERVVVSGRDEIADLSNDVNTLAKTLSENLTARQRWVADISHELRTPLAIIQGEIEALRDGVRRATPETIESLHVEVLRLGQLTNDLHELSMSDAGALNYRFEQLDIAALLRNESEKFLLRSEQQQLQLSLNDIPSAPMLINGDKSRLAQLVNNLLENSLRYTYAGGRIEIRINRGDQNVVIEFSDTAPAVSVEDCEHLFERLYRVESSRSRTTGGSGLGLAIVKNIVEAHQGTIIARPSALGGLSIVVELPL